jgi:hypothetical protein
MRSVVVLILAGVLAIIAFDPSAAKSLAKIITLRDSHTRAAPEAVEKSGVGGLGSSGAEVNQKSGVVAHSVNNSDDIIVLTPAIPRKRSNGPHTPHNFALCYRNLTGECIPEK